MSGFGLGPFRSPAGPPPGPPPGAAPRREFPPGQNTFNMYRVNNRVNNEYNYFEQHYAPAAPTVPVAPPVSRYPPQVNFAQGPMPPRSGAPLFTQQFADGADAGDAGGLMGGSPRTSPDSRSSPGFQRAPDVQCTPLSHPAFHSRWNRQQQGPRAAFVTPGLRPHGPARVPPTPFSHASVPYSDGSPYGGGHSRAPHLTVDSLVKATKAYRESKKYFSGDSEDASGDFLDWLTFWGDVASGQDPRLSPYFSPLVLDWEEEEFMVIGPDSYLDRLLFRLLKSHLTGSAEQVADSMKDSPSGRTLILDLCASYSQTFAGDAEAVRSQIRKVEFETDKSPMPGILRIEKLTQRLATIQLARGAVMPDIHETCLEIIRKLPSPGPYDELKRMEGFSSEAAELYSLYDLRVTSQKLFQLYVRNNCGQSKSGLKRASADLFAMDSVCANDDGEICAVDRAPRFSGGAGQRSKVQRVRPMDARPKPGERRELRPCLFCKATARAGQKAVKPDDIRHRFSDCPLLPSDLRKALSDDGGVKFLAGLDELNADTMDAELDYAKDFIEQLDGWGNGEVSGLDFLAKPVSTHPLAREARRVVE